MRPSVAIAAGALACASTVLACAEEPEPRAPMPQIVYPGEYGYARLRQEPHATVVYVPAPEPSVTAIYTIPPPPTESRIPPPHPLRRDRSTSLGFIGDWPIGQYDQPWHPPYWTRPFPARWERSFYSPGYYPYYWH